MKAANTASYYVAFIALGLVAASLGPALPNLAENTRSTLSQISYAFTAHSLGYLIGSSQVGRLYDRMRGHPLMAATLVIMAGLMLTVPSISHLWLLILVYGLIGMAASALDVGANTLLVWIHGESVGPFMNALHFFFGLGAFLAPMIAAQVMRFYGNSMGMYWVLGTLIMPVSLLILRLPSPPVPARKEEEEGGQLPVVPVVLIAIFFFLCVGAEVGLGNWIYTYALKMELADETVAAYLNAAFWGAFTVGRLLGIPVAAVLRPRTMLLGNLVFCLLGVLMLLLWPHSTAVVWSGVILAGLAIAPLFATTMSLAERLMPISGRVTGWFFVGVSAGSLVMPWLIGQLFTGIGPQVVMWVALSDILLAILVYAVLITVFARSARQEDAHVGSA